MPDGRNGSQPAIGDYALIGDRRTAALVSRQGSVDWLCLPRFDSRACFARLLGHPEHGHWRLAPAAEARAVQRRYKPETLILETETETAEGRVLVTDFMPEPEDEGRRHLVRVVRGLKGSVAMRLDLVLRPAPDTTKPASLWNWRACLVAGAGFEPAAFRL